MSSIKPTELSFLFSPISTLLGNFSAWQQPFWEWISKGHCRAPHRLLNFELECTQSKTRMQTHAKMQTPKPIVTHARAVMYIMP